MGDAVAVTYTKSDSSVIVDSEPTITDEPIINWSNQSFVAGIYETNEAVELDDGSFVDSALFYRLHPDGTGQLEIEIIDPATGLLDLINISSFGICWVLDGVSNKLTWSRVLVPNDLFTAVRYRVRQLVCLCLPSHSTLSEICSCMTRICLASYRPILKIESILIVAETQWL